MANSSRREQLQKLIADDPGDPFPRYALAMELEADGDTTGAVEMLRGLVADFPEYVPAFLQAGQLLLKQDNPDEARGILKMGMDVALKVADMHAYAEMEALYLSLE
jgi:predicted Zn-dependent protease